MSGNERGTKEGQGRCQLLSFATSDIDVPDDPRPASPAPASYGAYALPNEIMPRPRESEQRCRLFRKPDFRPCETRHPNFTILSRRGSPSSNRPRSICNAGESLERAPSTTETLNIGMNIGFAQRQTRPLRTSTSDRQSTRAASSTGKIQHEAASSRTRRLRSLVRARRKGARRPPAHDGSS